jgi:hypothetical protein
MDPWRHGDIVTGRHGDMEIWRHGDIKWKTEAQAIFKIRLLCAHCVNRSLLFVRC